MKLARMIYVCSLFVLLLMAIPLSAQDLPKDYQEVLTSLARTGDYKPKVLKVNVPRNDLHLIEVGAAINARMGLNSWAAFAGNDADAQVAGDIAMRESEVNAVLKALRSHGLNIVAIHNHMLDTHPTVIFLHYWGRGPAPKLAAGFRSALDVLGK